MKNKTELQLKAIELLAPLSFDHLSVGFIDFSAFNYDFFEIVPEGISKKVFYDLASVTKPLVLASSYLYRPDWFDSQLKLTLNHQAGIPSWGRISHPEWREFIKSFSIEKSATLYSDYSALRTMIELEDRNKINLKKECTNWWDEEIYFWKDLPHDVYTPPTGFRGGRVIQGEVHDPNAYVINEFCSHAGLFGSMDGVCKTILNLQKKYNLLDAINLEFTSNKNLDRFIWGWDRAQDLQTTLAGQGCSEKTFGHLGFTGTSIWIDIEKKKAVVVLSNATKNYWYHKDGINNIRRVFGEYCWRS
jgi:CubicO group peptidase (beta-lactamase class C family)